MVEKQTKFIIILCIYKFLTGFKPSEPYINEWWLSAGISQRFLDQVAYTSSLYANFAAILFVLVLYALFRVSSFAVFVVQVLANFSVAAFCLFLPTKPGTIITELIYGVSLGLEGIFWGVLYSHSPDHPAAATSFARYFSMFAHGLAFLLGFLWRYFNLKLDILFLITLLAAFFSIFVLFGIRTPSHVTTNDRVSFKVVLCPQAIIYVLTSMLYNIIELYAIPFLSYRPLGQAAAAAAAAARVAAAFGAFGGHLTRFTYLDSIFAVLSAVLLIIFSFYAPVLPLYAGVIVYVLCAFACSFALSLSNARLAIHMIEQSCNISKFFLNFALIIAILQVLIGLVSQFFGKNVASYVAGGVVLAGVFVAVVLSVFRRENNDEKKLLLQD